MATVCHGERPPSSQCISSVQNSDMSDMDNRSFYNSWELEMRSSELELQAPGIVIARALRARGNLGKVLPIWKDYR